LWTLAIVSFWRVLLLARVAATLLGLRTIQTFWIVALYGNGIIFALLSFTDVPVFNLMGGVRQSDEDAIVAATVFNVTLLSFITVPLLVLASVIAWIRWQPTWQLISTETDSSGSATKPLLAVTALSIFVWLPFLPATQPPQQHRHEAEAKLRSGDITGGLAYMSGMDRTDFPQIWDPPPRISYHERSPDLFKVVDAAIVDGSADWVRGVFAKKLEAFVNYQYRLEAEELSEVLNLLQRLPEGQTIARNIAPLVERQFKYTDPDLPEYESLKEFLTFAGVEILDDPAKGS
jgi:hypothetical protein